MATALEKPYFVTQESKKHLERFNFDTTLNQIKQSNKGKHPPENTKAKDQRKMLTMGMNIHFWCIIEWLLSTH